MLIKLIEVYSQGPQSTIRELFVNSTSIISITAETRPRPLEEAKSLGLSDFTNFSTVVINEGVSTRVITVAHSPEEIQKRIRSSKKLLKG